MTAEGPSGIVAELNRRQRPPPPNFVVNKIILGFPVKYVQGQDISPPGWSLKGSHDLLKALQGAAERLVEKFGAMAKCYDWFFCLKPAQRATWAGFLWRVGGLKFRGDSC